MLESFTDLATHNESVGISADLLVIEHLRMTTSKQVPPLTPVITIGSSILSTLGNITTISGEGKSGKTAFLGALMAGAITEDNYYDGFKDLNVAQNKEKKAVIHFETEQSEPRHQTNHKTIIERAGLKETPAHFLSYNIRRNAIKEYRELVQTACSGAKEKFGSVYLVIIDGAADFINDVNDAAEANALVKWLEELSIEFNCPVVVVVHVNPGSDKERGHLGSQLQRKCESLLFIKRKEDISTVEAKLLRNAGIGDTPQIQFTYDKLKGYHVSCDAPAPQASNKDLLRVEELRKTANIVYKNGKSFGYQDSIDEIMRITIKGISTAKIMHKEMKTRGFIVQNDENKYMLNLQPV